MSTEQPSITSKNIESQTVKVPELLSDSEFADLTARFSEADVRTVRTILNDQRAERVKIIFNGRMKPDGSGPVGVYGLMKLIEKTGVKPRRFEGVMQQVILAQAAIEREIAQIASARDEVSDHAEVGSEAASEEKLDSLLEQLAVLMLLENWLKTVESSATFSQKSEASGQSAAQNASQEQQVGNTELIDTLRERLERADNLLGDEAVISQIVTELEQLAIMPPNPNDQQAWDNLRATIEDIETRLTAAKDHLQDGNVQQQIVQTIGQLDYSLKHIATPQPLSPTQTEQLWELAGGTEAEKVKQKINKLKQIAVGGQSTAPIIKDVADLIWIKKWALENEPARKFLKNSADIEHDQSTLTASSWPTYLRELADFFTSLSAARSSLSEHSTSLFDRELFEKMTSELTSAQARYVETILSQKDILFPGFNQLELQLDAFELPENQPDHEATYRFEVSNRQQEIDAIWSTYEASPDFPGELLGEAGILRVKDLVLENLKRKLEQADRNRRVRDEERHKQIEKVLSNASYGSAARFFEQGYAAAYIPQYENLRWKEESPKKLAEAMFKYVRDVVMTGHTNKDEIFVSMDIMNHELDMSGNIIKIGVLAEQFKNLALLYVDAQGRVDQTKITEFNELSAWLTIDFARISQIYRLGNEIHNLLKNGDDALTFIKGKKEAVLNADEFRRMFSLGERYVDANVEMPLGRQLFYAMQLYLFQNEPTYYPIGVMSTSPPDKPIYSRNVRIKSPITHFPTISASEGQGRINQYFQRNLLAKINAGWQPPWEQDAEWQRVPGETLGQLAERRLRIGRRYMTKELLGFPDLPDDADTLTNDPNDKRPIHEIATDSSFYKRCKRYLDGDASAFTPEEKAAVEENKGQFYTQQMASLLGEYFLLFAKAEGKKKTKAERVLSPAVKMVEVSGKHGPTSEVPFVRGFDPQGYSNKLISGEGGTGTPGPKRTKDIFYGFFQTLLDRYSYIPDGETSGVSLRDLFLVTDKPTEFTKLPFQKIMPVTEGNAPWNKSFDVGLFNHGAIAAGLGVNWHNIVKVEQGTEGAVTTFDPEIAAKLSKIARQGYYLLEQDFGNLVFTMGVEEYDKFRIVEQWWEEEIAAGRTPAMPASVPGILNGVRATVPVTQELWNKILEYNRKPTDNHQIFDGSPSGDLSNRDQQKVARYAARVNDFMWIPPEGFGRMNKFEEAVRRESAGDESRVFVKLYVGGLLIGDISRSGTSGMDAKDAKAFQMALSWEYYRKRIPRGLIKKMLEKVVGRTYDLDDYEGVGFFTPAEVEAMMNEANVPGGFILAAREVLATIQTFGK